jgi:dTDP-4-amino-4,6-dideoxygalactose transaminase
MPRYFKVRGRRWKSSGFARDAWPAPLQTVRAPYFTADDCEALSIYFCRRVLATMDIAYAEALSSVPTSIWRRGKTVPLNRLETRTWDLLAALSWIRHDALAELRAAFEKLTERRIIFSSSGQCAIAQILALLPQREVVMPAYTCGVVKTAAQAAGKRIVYVDVAKGSVNATSVEYAEAANPGRILLATHLYGVPTDIEAVCRLARSRDCVVIEDSVAAFGGYSNGQPLGTFGDFGIFSFQRGKRIPAVQGAAIIVNNERLLEPAKLESVRFAESRRRLPVRGVLAAWLYNMATIPPMYGSVTVPLLLSRYKNQNHRVRPETGRETYEPEAEVAAARKYAAGSPYYRDEIHPYQAELVLRMLRRIGSIRRHIARTVEIYLEALQNTSWRTFLPPNCDYSGLLRLPVALPGRKRAEILIEALKRGIYLEVEYESLLPVNSERTRFPNAIWGAENLILLPLYTALSHRAARSLARRVSAIGNDASIAEPA